MIEGRKKRRKRGREKMKKMPQTAQTVMKQKPKGNCHMFFHPLQDFFFPTRLSATNLSTTAVPRRGHWGLQLGPAVGVSEDLPGHDGLSQKGGGRTLLSALTHGRRPEQGVPPNTRMPIHKGTPPPPASPTVTCPPIKT